MGLDIIVETYDSKIFVRIPDNIPFAIFYYPLYKALEMQEKIRKQLAGHPDIPKDESISIEYDFRRARSTVRIWGGMGYTGRILVTIDENAPYNFYIRGDPEKIENKMLEIYKKISKKDKNYLLYINCESGEIRLEEAKEKLRTGFLKQLFSSFKNFFYRSNS